MLILIIANIIQISPNEEVNINYKIKQNKIFNLIDNSQIVELESLMIDEPNLNIYDSNGYTPLIKAIIKQDLNIVKILIESKANPTLTRNISKIYKNKGEDYKKTPLMYASSVGNLEIVKYLLSIKKVKLNRKNGTNLTALDFAIKNNRLNVVKYLFLHRKNRNKNSKLIKEAFEIKSLELVNYFIKHKIKLNIEKDQLLEIAIKNHDILSVKFLLNKNNKIKNKPFITGETPLTLAVKENRLNIVKYLIDLNVDLNKKNRLGESALIIATKYAQRGQIFDLLINSKIDINITDSENKPAIFWAIEKNKIRLVKKLIDTNFEIKDSKNRNLYFYAIHNFQIFKLLYTKNKPNIFQKDIYNKMLLDYILTGDNRILSLFNQELKNINKDNNVLLKAITFGNYDIVEILLKSGISPDIENTEPALWRAVKMNRVDLVYLLLHYKASRKSYYKGKSIVEIAEDARNLRILYLLREIKF